MGQVIDVAAIAPRVFPNCICTSIDPPAILVEERNAIVLLSDSQAKALGSTTTCIPPDVLLDGGIPSGPEILPPRSVDGTWNVPLVCGVTEELVTVLGPDCTGNCTACTIRFSVQGRIAAAMTARRAVVLLSGGLDSATCLAMARSEGFLCSCLLVDYGQRHRVELERARVVARGQGVEDVRVVQVDLRAIGGSALTADIDVPEGRVRRPRAGRASR